jgi:hypothetical protein
LAERPRVARRRLAGDRCRRLRQPAMIRQSTEGGRKSGTYATGFSTTLCLQIELQTSPLKLVSK